MSQEQNMPAEYTAQNDPITAMAERYGMMPQALYNTLRQTVFAAARNDAEFDALCLIAKTYGLNPITREIYAFPSKGGGVVPLIGIDGYIAVMNRQPSFDGLEFAYSENLVAVGNVKSAPEWCEARIYKKGCTRPTVVREYMDECFRPTEPWRSHPRRMLRHKALAQCVRTAFGMSGVYSDLDEAEALTVSVEETKRDVNAAINAAIEAPAQEPKKRGRPRKVQQEPAPAPTLEPVQETVQESPAQDAVKIEEAFELYLEDNDINSIKANDICMRMIQNGEAADLLAAKTLFVQRSMSV